MQEGYKKPVQKLRTGRKKAARRRAVAPKDNEHLKDVLEDYNEMTAESRQVSAGDKKK